jgi:hypothetical protein
MRPCERAGDVWFYSTPAADSLFPDAPEPSNRQGATFRGVAPDAVVRVDAGVPGLGGAPCRFPRGDRPPAAV